MEVRGWARIIFFDLQLRSGGECRHRNLAVHPAAFDMVGCRHRWRGHELRVELCRDVGLYLARKLNLDTLNFGPLRADGAFEDRPQFFPILDIAVVTFESRLQGSNRSNRIFVALPH